MSTTGRTLLSTSTAANTGMRSAVDIAGLGAGATFTLYFWFKDLGGNASRTLWADENGGCQVFYTTSTRRLFVRYADSANGGVFVTLATSGWHAVCIRFGLNISGTDDFLIESYSIADDALSTASGSTSVSGSPLIEGDSVHYAFGDDNAGGATDGGLAAKMANICLMDGLFTINQTGFDTTLKEAKAFDPGAESALIYALRGQDSGSPGFDNSGNGNDFVVESSGVTFDEADLPPGMSLPAATGSFVGGAVIGPAGTASGSAQVTRIATGDVISPAHTASGAGAVTRTVSGSVTAPPGVASGSAAVTRTVSGAVVGPAGEASGQASIVAALEVSGDLQGPAGTASGQAAVTKVVSGALIGPAGVASGSAQTGSGITGQLVGPAGVGSGQATVTRVLAGDVQGPAVTTSGTASVTRTVGGALVGPAGTASGVAAQVAAPTVSGALTGPAGTASGSAVVTRLATAAVIAPAGEVSGEAAATRLVSGTLISPAGVMSGTAVAGASSDPLRVFQITGKRRANFTVAGRNRGPFKVYGQRGDPIQTSA